MKPAEMLFALVALSFPALGAMGSFGLAPGALVGTALFLVSRPLVRRLDPEGGMRLLEIFALAVALRWVTAAFAYLVVEQASPGLIAPDEMFYDYAGRYYAEYLAGRVPDPYPDSSPGGVILVSGLSYWAFGFAPMVPRLVNGILGGWSAVITGVLALQLCGSTPVARRAAFIAAVVPSLVLFGALNTKDNTTMLGAELVLVGFLKMRDRFSLAWLAAFLIGVSFIAFNRTYELIFIGVGVGAGLVFTEQARSLRNIVATVGLCIILGVVVRATRATDVVNTSSDVSTMETIAILRTGYSTGAGSAINIDLVDTSTAGGLALWAPLGLAYFFLAPIPFTGSSMLSRATSPEMVVWYWLLPAAWRGARLVARRRFRSIMPLIIYMLGSSIGWALVVTNVGTLYRYRAQVLFIPIIFIAADQARRKYASGRKSALAPGALAAVRAPLPPFDPRPSRLPGVATAGR